ncbi:MAG: GYF domain-containing protein [Thiothrix sp.]|uniref:GYF domain-containing protein n=1 Tax=Thiothrix sp. TaxID=1032 RepID=UPI00261EA3C3|nr:GYF domain-containing protein [Thiothrix sp.]MDD5395560.1 GYF domain-containing protein [Thiothrix sp.]
MQFNISRDGQQYGPYGEDEVRTMLEQGQLLSSDLAWKEGMADWRPLSQILPQRGEALASATRVAPPPPATKASGSIKGCVLSFDPMSGQGYISGRDGNRYLLVRSNWHAGRAPMPGLDVDFVADANGHATQIFIEPSFVTRANMSKGVLALVCWFVGLFGVHRFLVGKVGTGVTQLIFSLTVIGLIVSVPWVIVDFVMILAGSFTDKKGNPIVEWW